METEPSSVPAPARAEARPSGTASRGPGRPRDEGHDERIISAAVELMERGEEITVNRVVEVSGVSRSAIYRRWPSMTDLLSAALDHGRAAQVIPVEGDLLENVLNAYSVVPEAVGAEYSEDRLRLRLRLAISDRRLAKAYWRSHVSRRREGMSALLREGIARGELREDIDIDACIDLINGVFYYQFVVRGESLQTPDAIERCRAAIKIVWSGMRV
ncbi:TetR/AcrR family transcriptional regulator [Cellulosimicrobium funkei]|nr:TetR/AcrR family transcriptional regulator [Cellulosimicrobium funkei]